MNRIQHNPLLFFTMLLMVHFQ